MPYWLANTLIVVLIAIMFLILFGVAIMQFSYRLMVEKEKNRQLEKENKHKQELLDAYGIKEINIGGKEE